MKQPERTFERELDRLTLALSRHFTDIYTASVRWSRYQHEGGNIVVEVAFGAFLPDVQQFARRFEHSPGLPDALELLEIMVDDYEFLDAPVWNEDGTLNVGLGGSSVRHGFRSGDPSRAQIEKNGIEDVRDREVVLLQYRNSLAQSIKAIRVALPDWGDVQKTGLTSKTIRAPEAPPLIPLRDRFRSPQQFERFIALLVERRIVDVDGAFLAGHGQKSRLWGAYEGASENRTLKIAIGTDAEIVATLNDAFPSLTLSAARPQDLRGTKAHAAMRAAFQVARFPP
ncbi:MAG: hypothetical protein JST66_01315 [Bacteroidetes bacterium]|nr:hypothetical protein [Bacteroidota bacterium]